MRRFTVRVIWEPRDIWIGFYFARWRPLDLYVCLIPMVPIRITDAGA